MRDDAVLGRALPLDRGLGPPPNSSSSFEVFAVLLDRNNLNSGIVRTTMTVVSILYKTYVTDLELRQAKFCITVLYGVTFAKSRERMLR